MVIDPKGRVLLLNEESGLQFNDAVTLCHKLGGQLPQVTERKNTTAGDDVDFLSSVMAYNKFDNRDDPRRMIWLGAKKSPGEDKFSWLTEPHDHLDKDDDTWKHMDIDLDCDKKECCALVMAPPKIFFHDNFSRKFRVTNQECSEANVRALCRLNIDLRDIPAHGSIEELNNSIDEIKVTEKGLETQIHTLAKNQDELGKSDILKDVKKSVETTKTEVAGLKTSIEHLKTNLEDAKKRANETFDKSEKTTQEAVKNLTAKMDELEKDVNKLGEEFPKQIQTLDNLLKEHRKTMDTDLKSIEDKVNKTTALSGNLEKNITDLLKGTGSQLKADLTKYDNENKDTLQK